MTATEHRSYINSLASSCRRLDDAVTLLQETHERNDQTRRVAQRLTAIQEQLEDLQGEDFLEAGQ